MSELDRDYPEHQRTSCDDVHLFNIDPDGTGCHRCNAIALAQRKAAQVLVAVWQARALTALPSDAMLINRHVRELNEALTGVPKA
ncbi:MAG: hypothetical protein RSG92_15335 [Pseudomonas sp.]